MGEVWEPRMVRRPDGAKRAKSKKSRDSERELMYDSEGNLLGPPESRAPDVGELERLFARSPAPSTTQSRELTPGQQAAADVIGEAVAEIVAAIVRDVAVPALKYAIPMVKEKVADAIETRRALAVERRLSRISKKTSIDAAPANDIANTVDSPTVVMTADQFREHVRLNAKVQAWLAQHKDMLDHVVVVDDTSLTPQLRQAITLVLDGRSHELDEDTLRQLSDYFRDTTEQAPAILPTSEKDPACE